MAPNPFAAEAYAPPSNAQQYYGQYGQYPQMQGYPQAPPAPETNLTGAAAFGVSKSQQRSSLILLLLLQSKKFQTKNH
ncbi:Hypothetical protein FKW44_021227 [Caligus rogercresseyi]|uniref:Uncharacterized protein n=1 Tax=Caligus rogercresseyi TaxID=217165 RepID=A0A7T8JVM4_CALRO|nr:Hypothetical protein FKW44_021227 [Caligus rogercresseyi]